MSVEEDKTYGQNWDNKSFLQVKRELEDGMSVHLIPEQFHHGIQRIALFLAEYDSGIVLDETSDLTAVFHEVVNYPDLFQYDPDGTMACIALGSEFDIFSVQRSPESGDIHLAQLRPHSIPFLMSVCADYELGLRAYSLICGPSAFLGSSGEHDRCLVWDQWREICRTFLAAAISDSDVPLSSEAVMVRFAHVISSTNNDLMLSNFGDSDGFQKVVKNMTDLGVIRQASGRVMVLPETAVVFLTEMEDVQLLEKLQVST